MCGIAGYYSRGRSGAEPVIEKMTRAILHRGPDDGGTWVSKDETLALGHRRLAILDLSPRGHQPMVTDDGQGILAYNGEIYNFREVRTELEAKGVSFKSESDTEVLLQALKVWGIEAVHRFNGMWAFIYVDAERQTLWASRDRTGIKPLYYAWDNQTLLISSEVKGILASGHVKRAVDLDGLNEYFTFQNIISDRTLFAGVRMLQQGCNLELNLHSGQLNIKKYWDFDYTPDAKLTEVDAAEMFVKEFDAAVERHMISDVPVGATISGGMDSSAIVERATKKTAKLQTFTGYFDTTGLEAGDRSFSERNDALLVSETFGTVHRERLITWQDQLAAMPAIVWHLEDPKVAMCYTFFDIAQLVSSHITVNLSGTGGDEIFAGYPWRYALIEQAVNRDEFLQKFFGYWSRVIQPSEKAKFFTAKARAGMNAEGPFSEFAKIVDAAGDLSPVNKALYFEAKTFLHGMLMVEDKMGMAFSIETRFPFLDKNLIEIAQKIPDHLKYKGGIGKYIFRRAFEKSLPTQITQKKKQGFTPPDFTWYRRELRDWVETTLMGRRTMCHEWIEPTAIRTILERLDKGEDMRFQVWSLLFFEGWCRTFLRDEPHGVTMW